MTYVRVSVLPMLTAALCLAGCATSPMEEQRAKEVEADIDEILSLPLDEQQYGSTRNCLSQAEFRNFRPLDEEHILFQGSRNRLWINTLRTRCGDLRYGDVLTVRHFSGSQLCDADRFTTTDWFEWPWYRRSPQYWGATWGTGMQCVLGKFQPVTPDQVAEIDALLKVRHEQH
jgi:Family of unknown function (DUF6491)